MSSLKTPTSAADIAPPPEFVDVELPSLKKRDGSPVVIRLGRLNALRMGRLRGRLGGAFPTAGMADEAPAQPASEEEVVTERLLNMLIESAIEPRVTRDGAGDTLNTDWLSKHDVAALAEGLVEMTGLGGPDIRFPR